MNNEILISDEDVVIESATEDGEVEEIVEDTENVIETAEDEILEQENIENNEVIENRTSRKIGVYVKKNAAGFVTEINSDLFMENFDGWEKIDEGEGDKFAHAQTCYFEEPIIDENGNYKYKI